MSQGSPPLVSTEPSSDRSSPEPNSQNHVPTSKEETAVPATTRSNRPSRACTIRAASRLYGSGQPAAIERGSKASKKEQRRREESPEEEEVQQQCSKIVTPLVEPPSPSQLPRWNLRSMWELASILNFLHVFRPLLNISVEFSAEEFETALLTPNDTLSDIHMPLLKVGALFLESEAIPPITRMALTRDTWITVLCRKLRDWWHWVANGELPIVASHGVEVEVYKSLDPGVRVVILKALCDIRVEDEVTAQCELESSWKIAGLFGPAFDLCWGGDGYEGDPIIGHRLYREVRKTEVIQMKKGKPKGSRVNSSTTYQWEAVATNFDEFQEVSRSFLQLLKFVVFKNLDGQFEDFCGCSPCRKVIIGLTDSAEGKEKMDKLSSSKNRTEASLGKKLKIDMLPEIEKVHKRKERLLKKQHREALLLDNFLVVDGIGPGRSLRDRKPVTYTFGKSKKA
ncbi:DDT domain-containing protein DDR4-like [Senna tora]|uniref:DDT domain-containing protein DDR4-like n=1 Tax=Senna tora TaxID=362788 RepID=A0A834X512_9FABA|nr:DDT domain-containing protein DDR4-like [Senna tora]